LKSPLTTDPLCFRVPRTSPDPTLTF